jgi:hypothetical protein
MSTPCFLLIYSLYPTDVTKEELQNMHIGQAADLKWTHSRQCPTLEEYKTMVQNSETNPPSITYPTGRFELTAGDPQKPAAFSACWPGSCALKDRQCE